MEDIINFVQVKRMSYAEAAIKFNIDKSLVQSILLTLYYTRLFLRVGLLNIEKNQLKWSKLLFLSLICI